VTYTLDGNAFSINYVATTDADTVLNLTNHAYFNLDGHKNWSTLDNHTATIYADQYVPVDDLSIPTGGTMDVAGTTMDCRTGNRFFEWVNKIATSHLNFAKCEKFHFFEKYIYI